MQFKGERVTADGKEERKNAVDVSVSSGSDAQDRGPVCQDSKAFWDAKKKMPLPFFRSDTPTLFLWEMSLEGGWGAGFNRDSLHRFAVLRSAWEVRAWEMDGLPGWMGMDREQQLCGSLDKMLTVWNHIKDFNVEESVCGLARIQNVLWGFVVFKDW